MLNILLGIVDHKNCKKQYNIDFIRHRYICQEYWPKKEHNYYYSLALMSLQFIIPLTVLIFTYTRIAVAVWGKRTFYFSLQWNH